MCCEASEDCEAGLRKGWKAVRHIVALVLMVGMLLMLLEVCSGWLSVICCRRAYLVVVLL